MSGAPGSSSTNYQPSNEAQPSDQSRRTHALPPRPPVDSYRPSYGGGSNGRPLNNSNNHSNNSNNQYYSTYTSQQGGYETPQQRPPPQNSAYWYPPGQPYGQPQQPYPLSDEAYQQLQQPYLDGRLNRNHAPVAYSKWWNQPTGRYDQYGGRGDSYGPLEGGGVSVSRNDRYDQYDGYANGRQSLSTGSRNNSHQPQSDYDNPNNNNYRSPQRGMDDRHYSQTHYDSKEERRKAKKERKRAERAAQQPPRALPQQSQQGQQNIVQQTRHTIYQKSKGRSVLPVPKPTEDYLNLTESHLPDDPDSKKLLILDLNDTLVHRMPPNAAGNRSVRCRPFLTQFLDYIFANFSVMVWSSARPNNVASMVTGAFPAHHQKNILSIWSRENFGLKPEHYNSKIVTYKNLEMIWEKIPHPEAEEGKRWDQTNTILLDDSIEKACAQPYNHLLIDVWENPTKQAGDRTLLDVMGYLEKVCKPSGNISESMRETTFQPGSGMWEEFIPAEALVVKEEKMDLENEEEISLDDVDEIMPVESKDKTMVENVIETETKTEEMSVDDAEKVENKLVETVVEAMVEENVYSGSDKSEGGVQLHG